MNKDARKELAALSDGALRELKELLDLQYRSGYEYAEFRKTQSAKCGVPDKPSKEVLEAVLRPVPIEEFRAMIRAV